MILAGYGRATLKTVEGETLTLMMNGSTNILVKDAKGDVADITISDVTQSNGVIQVIDKVRMPAASYSVSCNEVRVNEARSSLPRSTR